MDKNGDAYEYENDLEENVIVPKTYKKSTFSIIFDGFSKAMLYLLVMFFGIHLLAIFFDLEYYTIANNLTLKQLNFSILLILGSFRLIVVLAGLTSMFLNWYNVKKTIQIYSKIYRLIIVLSWAVCSFIILSLQENLKDTYFIVYHVFPLIFSAIITSISYIIFVLLMIWFENHFIKAILKSKVSSTEDTENALKKFKKYAYGNESYSEIAYSTIEQDNNLSLNTGMKKIINLLQIDSDIEIQKYNLKVDLPAIFSLKEAISLAEDVFTKAAKSNNYMEFQEFSLMFQNQGDAAKNYIYFEFDDTSKISKKEFVKTIIFFYNSRADLEKAINSSSQFITAIKRIVYSIVFMFMTVIYLVVFGIKLQKLIALAISAGIAFNYIGGKILLDTWRSIIMLLSHQFDVGDEIILDGKPMKVYEIGLSSTSFILYNGGKFKVINSDLWDKVIINMTKAPEKKFVFNFEIPGKTTIPQITKLHHAVKRYLQEHSKDFFEDFTLSNQDTDQNISTIKSMITIKCRAHKTPTKKYFLRAEFAAFLSSVLENL